MSSWLKNHRRIFRKLRKYFHLKAIFMVLEWLWCIERTQQMQNSTAHRKEVPHHMTKLKIKTFKLFFKFGLSHFSALRFRSSFVPWCAMNLWTKAIPNKCQKHNKIAHYYTLMYISLTSKIMPMIPLLKYFVAYFSILRLPWNLKMD